MERKIVQDMVSKKDNGMAKSSNFAKATDPSSFFAKRKIPSSTTTENNFSNLIPNSKSPKVKLIVMAIVIVLVIIGTFVIGNVFFTKATITIVKKTESATIDSTIVAESESTDPSVLPFKLITIEERVEREIAASGSKFIEHKASGQIVVYNNYSSEPQRFVKNTRFQSTDGKVFRVNNSITVPGIKVVAGKTVPGSIEVTVYADQPGSEYNIAMSDFTLPGLKDSDMPKYKGFYARSKSPMTGGVSGEVVLPAKDELEKARVIMDKELEEKLTASVAGKVPPGSILFKSLSYIKYSLDEDNQIIAEKGNTPKTYLVREKGVLTGVTFDLNLLAQYLAKKNLQNYSGESVSISNLGDLVVIPTTPISDELPGKKFSFSVRGKTVFIWDIDTKALKEELKGIPKDSDSRESVFSKYPSILEAKVDIRPFWKQNFPSDIDRIIIEATTSPLMVK